MRTMGEGMGGCGWHEGHDAQHLLLAACDHVMATALAPESTGWTAVGILSRRVSK